MAVFCAKGGGGRRTPNHPNASNNSNTPNTHNNPKNPNTTPSTNPPTNPNKAGMAVQTRALKVKHVIRVV
jgi:hypothetical protein